MPAGTPTSVRLAPKTREMLGVVIDHHGLKISPMIDLLIRKEYRRIRAEERAEEKARAGARA